MNNDDVIHTEELNFGSLPDFDSMTEDEIRTWVEDNIPDSVQEKILNKILEKKNSQPD